VRRGERQDKAPAKKVAAKKTPAKKVVAKKAPAKKTAAHADIRVQNPPLRSGGFCTCGPK